MKTTLTAIALSLLASTAVLAQQTTPSNQPARQTETMPAKPMTSSPVALTSAPDGVTVTNYYKQNVYDPQNNKIGEIADVLLDQQGKVTAFIVSVGGFLGVGNKDVAVPFDAIHGTLKDNKWTLTMNADKDQLKSAPGYTYDRNTMKWVNAKS